MTLEQDWERVTKVYEQVKNAHWNPNLVISQEIYDLRKVDRGIDYPLRRLLDSEKYGNRIRVYGAPSSAFGRHPFRWDNKVWLLVRIVVQKQNPRNMNRVPYGFEPNSTYVCQVLNRNRWINKHRGKPTLKMLYKFKETMEKADTARMRKVLPNGVLFGACMASDHMAFLKSTIRYLENLAPNEQPISYWEYLQVCEKNSAEDTTRYL